MCLILRKKAQICIKNRKNFRYGVAKRCKTLSNEV